MINPNNEALSLELKSGVVIVDENPYYYIDLVHGYGGDLVFAYAMSKKSVQAYKETKDPNMIVKQRQVRKRKMIHYNNLDDSETSSDLSRHLANKLGNDNVYYKTEIVYKKALFASPVEQGKDSITGLWGRGFAEMKATRMSPVNNRQENPKMFPTGVFIGLNNVVWTKTSYDDKWLDYLEPLYQVYQPYFKTLQELE